VEKQGRLVDANWVGAVKEYGNQILPTDMEIETLIRHGCRAATEYKEKIVSV